MGSAGCNCYCQPSGGDPRAKGANTIPPTEYVPDQGEVQSTLCWNEPTQGRSSGSAESKAEGCCIFCPEKLNGRVPGTPAEQKLNVLRRQVSRETNASLIDNLKMVSNVAPFQVIKFDVLKAHGKLPRSEEGLQVLYDTLDPKTKVFFLSHRWLRPWHTKEECESHGCIWNGAAHPDDSNATKFELLIQAVEHIVKEKRRESEGKGVASLALTDLSKDLHPDGHWDISSVAVWLDFACIDQDDVALRTAGVSSLLGYVSRCDLAVIPTLQKPDHCTVHRMKHKAKQKKQEQEQDDLSDTDNYGVRAWTRLEAMCFYVLSLLRDQERPGLFYSAPGGDVGKMDYVLLPYTLPSEGTLTMASDLEVVLGHERTLLNVLHESAIGGCKPSKGPAMVAAAAATEQIQCALSNQKTSYLQDLIDHGLDPNTQDNQGLTALWSASFVGAPDQVQLLLTAQADPNVAAQSGLAALHNAARKGHLEIAALLLNHKADIEAQDKQGNTPLMWAVQHNRVEAATFLLDHGARSKLVKTLQLAQKLNYQAFIPLIVEHVTEQEVDKAESMVESKSTVEQEARALSMAMARARRVSLNGESGEAARNTSGKNLSFVAEASTEQLQQAGNAPEHSNSEIEVQSFNTFMSSPKSARTPTSAQRFARRAFGLPSEGSNS